MPGRDVLASFREGAPHIFPSLLRCDFGNLEREVRELEEAGITALHLDVMDGLFVPNLTYGMPLVEAFRRLTELPLDVHLMIEQPQRYLQQFADAGADVITVHVEACEDVARVLGTIQQMGLGAGLALNPSTPFETLEPGLAACDMVLIMSVEAGFGGQEFNPVALKRLRMLRDRSDQDWLLQVDGGVNAETIADCVAAGAHTLVVGSAIFNQRPYREEVKRLKKLAAEADQ
jgi:ribulose-phosphate 3-epimerase